MMPTLVSVEFRLSASAYDFWVDVRLRCFGDRWVAVADIADEPELGLGGPLARRSKARWLPLVVGLLTRSCRILCC